MINHLADYPEDLTGKKVVVVGGGAVGLDVVEYFVQKVLGKHRRNDASDR